MDTELSEHFWQYFDAVRADDAALRHEVFKLRYAVYCEELGYEPRSAFPDGEERDAFDAHSTFVLVRHRASGRAAGCMRLVHNAEPDRAWRLPFEASCFGHLEPSFADELEQRRVRICEVSRLAVHGDFRRRKGEAASPAGGDVDGGVRSVSDRQYPLIAMGLFLSATALCLHQDVDQVWVMMEPRLARLLGSCGLDFTPVGETIDFHSRRGPYRITRDDVRHGLRPQARHLLESLSARLCGP